MLKIGDFSKFSRVSIKTLRYYDEIGLLKPAEVDKFTGYRYYSVDQLSRLNRIMGLKDLGLSLEEINQLLAGNPSAEKVIEAYTIIYLLTYNFLTRRRVKMAILKVMN